MLGAWSVRFVGWVACSCFLSFVFLGVARRFELSPCNTIYACCRVPAVRSGQHAVRSTMLTTKPRSDAPAVPRPVSEFNKNAV